MMPTVFAWKSVVIAFVATGAICEVIGWSVNPRPEVWSLEVSRRGTSPASM